MKAMIAGGTGLIGSALAESLLEDGCQVSIISRNPDRVDSRYKPVSWEESSLIDELMTSTAVINLAGASLAGNNPTQMRWTPKRKEAILSSRRTAGRKLVQAIKGMERVPEVFLQASAIGYYGNQGVEPVDENSSPGNDFLAKVCLDWEASTAELEEIGVRRLVVRIGLVLSSEGGLLPTLALPFRFFIGGRIGSGQQYLSWIHIQDLVEGIKYLIENPNCQGAYNLSAPNPATNQVFSTHLGNALQKPVWLPVPSLLLKGFLGEAATLALEGRPVYPTRLLAAGYPFIYPDLDDSLIDLIGR